MSQLLFVLQIQENSGEGASPGKRFGNLDEPRWIRPISQSDTGELPELNCRYSDGSSPAVLDVINLELLRYKPHQHQQENWVINHDVPISKIDRINYESAKQFIDTTPNLWDGFSSSSNFVNNRVETKLIQNHKDSLRLIKVDNLALSVVESISGKKQLRGAFEFFGTEHALAVTDILQEERFLNQLQGKTMDFGGCLLTVSLGEPYKGFCYKLIAGVILPGESR